MTLHHKSDRNSASSLTLGKRAVGSDELRAWDREHSWHPFTHMRQYLATDAPFIEEGRGVHLRDIDGRWYYDGSSSIWLNVHGHRVQEIDDAIRAQLDRVAHCTMLGQANVPATLLARRLVEIAPDGLTRVQFSDSGATAVEIAIKIAIQYWANEGRDGKQQVLGYFNNYHGDTFGAMAVAPSEIFHHPFLSLLPVHPRVPYPACPDRPYVTPEDRCAPSILHSTEQALREHSEDIAAVIIEPVEGAGGILPAEPGFLRGLRELCDRYDVMMIVDEVATGFGRTGWTFACDAERVTPDLLCLGKGLSGGYLPVAATLATETIFEAFLGEVAERKTLFHGHSFAGNPLGCAASLANIDLFESLLDGLPEKVHVLHELIKPIQDLPHVLEVRHRGLMVGVELAADPEAGRPFSWSQQAGMVVTSEAQRLGLLIRPIGNVVIFMPPLVSTTDDLAEMAGMLREAVVNAQAELDRLAMESK